VTSLRETLRAGEGDTPAGVDLAGVRERARRLRRGRRATAAAAVLTAVAVAVPVVLLRPSPAPPVAAPAGTGLGCPDTLPDRPAGPRADGTPLVPFAPTDGLLCGYHPIRVLGLVTRLTADQVRAVAARLDAARPPGARGTICPANLGVTYGVQLAGAGRVVTLRVDTGGCGTVSDGARTVSGTGFADILGRSYPVWAGCPATASSVGLGGRAGGPLLPAATRRLLLCGYRDNRPLDPMGVPRVVEGAAARGYARALDAAPPGGGGCDTAPDRPRLLVVAVTPTGTTRVFAEPGGCRSVSDGRRTVRDPAVVDALWALSQR
jgi:hypothetical protein